MSDAISTSTVVSQSITSPATIVLVSYVDAWPNPSPISPIATLVNGTLYYVVGVLRHPNALIFSTPVAVADAQWSKPVTNAQVKYTLTLPNGTVATYVVNPGDVVTLSGPVPIIITDIT